MNESTAHLAGTGPAPPTITTSAPFANHMQDKSIRVGDGDVGPDWPKEAVSFADYQAPRNRVAVSGDPSRESAVAWINDLAETKRDPGEVVDAVIERVMLNPDTATILKAQALLCELGRDERTSGVIGTRVTREVVARAARSADSGEALETIGRLYNGPNRTGKSTVIGICQGTRYNHANGAVLQQLGFYGAIRSGLLYDSPRVDVSLILFWDDHFNGNFVQMTAPKGAGEIDFWVSGAVHSCILVTSAPGGSREVRLSYRSLFFQQWKDIIDDQIRGDGRRDVDPILTWDMFENDPKYTGLKSDLPYLKVHQDLMVFVPWPYQDYHVWLEYWIYLYPHGTGVRATVPQYSWWVESGLITGKVADRFAPKVKAGAATLQDKLNAMLARFDGLAPNGVHDIYYLPGVQGAPPSGDVRGKTTDDITIVVAT